MNDKPAAPSPDQAALRQPVQAAPGACPDCKPGRGAGGPMIPYTCPKCQAAPGAVAWRFWVNDPTSCFMPHWTGWSTDVGFKELSLKLGHRPEYAAPHATPVGECAWTFDDNDYAPKWDTSCGEAYCFIEGGPEDNSAKFCHGCGKPIAAGRPASR